MDNIYVLVTHKYFCVCVYMCVYGLLFNSVRLVSSKFWKGDSNTIHELTLIAEERLNVSSNSLYS